MPRLIMLMLAAVMTASPAIAETTTPQLYAALEEGILVLTTDPCDARFDYPTLFEFAAYAVVDGEPETKEGCWFGNGSNVNMMFPDQPGVHNWAGWLFTPEVPVR